jgi:flagellar basal-body rod modification protein FlgD
MASAINALSGGDTATGANGTAAAPATGALAQKETFLKLLVAQIRNQDPASPADGIEFVSQLAQFSQLEQIIEIRSQLEAIGETMAARPAAGETETEGA